MGYKTISQSGNIIDLEKVKKHCFIYGNNDDDLLNMYIKAACGRFTEMTGIVINPSTIEFACDSFCDVVRIYRSPITEIVSISYVDKNGDTQSISPDSVIYDDSTRPIRLVCKDGKFPDTNGTPGNVKIRFKAGHESVDDLPDMVEWAILSMVATMYEFRENTVSGTIVSNVPDTAQMVIEMYRIIEV